jgi:hypothetical protein
VRLGHTAVRGGALATAPYARAGAGLPVFPGFVITPFTPVPRSTPITLVLLALLCMPAASAPNHVPASRHGLTALAKTAPVCSLPQPPRRLIGGLRLIRIQARADAIGRLDTVRATRADTPGPPLPRPRKCPPPRAIGNCDPAALAALLVGAFV